MNDGVEGKCLNSADRARRQLGELRSQLEKRLVAAHWSVDPQLDHVANELCLVDILLSLLDAGQSLDGARQAKAESKAEPREMMQKLAAAYDEYVNLLANWEKKTIGLLFSHGYETYEQMTQKGFELRLRIADLKDALGLK